MTTTETVLLILLVVVAVALAVFILLQHGKGADVGAAFGSGSANTMFGSGGTATFLTKATAWLAISFFAISFGLAYVAKERAVAEGTAGIPQADSAIVAPEPEPAELTEPDEGVDSDIPDV